MVDRVAPIVLEMVEMHGFTIKFGHFTSPCIWGVGSNRAV